MHEEKREIVTKEMILAKFKKTTAPTYIVGGGILLLCVIVFGISMSLILNEVFSGLQKESAFTIIIGAGMMIGTIVIGIMAVREIIKTVRNLRDIHLNQIVIERAIFLRHVEYECPRTQFSDGYDMVYFQDGKTFKIHRNHDRSLACTSRLSTALQLSENGDPYIVVTFSNDPNTVVDLYCEKFYAYRE